MFDAGVVATAQPLGGGVGASLTVTQIRIEKTPNEPDNTSEDGWIDVMIRNTGNEPVRYHFGVTLVITRVIVQALT